MTDTIQALLDHVHAGAWPDDYNASSLLPHPNDCRALAAFEGSLDAALALHQAMLPGWFFYGGNLHGKGDGYVYTLSPAPFPDAPSFRGFSDASPARAWVEAILMAVVDSGSKL